MKILTAAQMRALDRHCIETLGIPARELMARAGRAVAEAALDLGASSPGPILVLCGKGNNGGDGFEAARLLCAEGRETRVIFPFAPDELSPESRAMYDGAVAAGVAVATTVSDNDLSRAGVVIDALLGTGVTGPARGVMAELIARTNALRRGRGVIAVDVPSGVETDTGRLPGPAMRAALTVTMGLPKPCLVLHPGAEWAGRWTVADIGFPPEVTAAWPAAAELTEAREAAALLPPRPPTAFKGSVGEALVIAGSYGMTGAAAMACASAYRAGAGLVRLALPAALVPALNATLVEVVFLPVAATAAGTLSFHAVEPVLRQAAHARAALIGPGLSRNAATANAIRRLVRRLPLPLVVDADALTAMAGHDALWSEREAPAVITPHPGEMARLLGLSVPDVERDRLSVAGEAARRCNAVTVLKGAPAVIAAPDGRVYVNPTGTPALAVAGTGDVLAGAITAFLAQGLPPLSAAVLACYVGGRAAEMLTAARGLRGMTARDLLDALPAAMAALEKG